jgi:hypothetical protein
MLHPRHYMVSTQQYPEASETLIDQLGNTSERLSNSVAVLLGPLVHQVEFPAEGVDVLTYKYKTQIDELTEENFESVTALLAAELLELLQTKEPGKTIKPYRLVFAVPGYSPQPSTKQFTLLSQFSLV